jgi:hypothetical protein
LIAYFILFFFTNKVSILLCSHLWFFASPCYAKWKAEGSRSHAPVLHEFDLGHVSFRRVGAQHARYHPCPRPGPISSPSRRFFFSSYPVPSCPILSFICPSCVLVCPPPPPPVLSYPARPAQCCPV